MPARLHWNPLPQEQEPIDATSDVIVDSRGCTVQLGNGFLYLDVAADADHSLLGYDVVAPIATSGRQVASLIESFAPGYRCVALTDGLESGLTVGRSIAGESVDTIDALDGIPMAAGRPLIVIESRSLGRTGAWLACLSWPHQPAVIVIGEVLASGAPFAAVLVRGGAAAPPGEVAISAKETSLSRVAGTIVAVERGGVVSGAARLAGYFSQRMDSLVETDGDYLAVEAQPFAARITFKATAAPHMKRKLCERGVLVGLDADARAITIVPPLIIRPAEIDVITGTLRGALHDIPTWRPSACCAACEAIGAAY